MSHIFISYAHKDYEYFVQRLRQDLGTGGLEVWIDQAGLKAGTADWENAVRDAIAHARALILVASPDSRESQYVRDELAIARMYGKSILTVWARGEDNRWPECIPIGYGYTQYVDMRGAQYMSGLKRLLADLEGVAPSVEAVPALAGRPTIPAAALPPRNPYKGLNPFTADDRDDFFGREMLTLDLVARVKKLRKETPRFMGVVGASGSGKSSLVMAGILPELTTDPDWLLLQRMTPGTHPLKALRRVLVPHLPDRPPAVVRDTLEDGRAEGLYMLVDEIAPNGTVVLFIDQFEELFTLTSDEDERRQFIDLIVSAVEEPSSNLLVLVTLRADFYQLPLNYPRLAALLDGPGIRNVPAMTTSNLVDAIMKPAERAGLAFESGLVAEIIHELRVDQRVLAGALPLLQFTLERLYEERDGHTLTLEAYRRMGGVQGAIGSHAEAIYMDLEADAQATLPDIFLALVNVDERGIPTRKRAPLRAVTATAPARQLTNALIENRLLVASHTTGEDPQPTHYPGETGSSSMIGGAYVELAHEALLRTWERLVEWIDTIAEDLRLRDEVERAALRWDNEHRPDYLLWPHERLAPVYAMQQRLMPDFEANTLDFIKPEAERLMQQFIRRSTPFHRRLTIIDRWREIGLSTQPVIEAALDYADADTYPYLSEMVDLLTAIADLSSGKRAQRVDAVDYLCNISDPMAANALLGVINDEDVVIRRMVVVGLGQLGDPSAVPALVASLEDPDPIVRRNTAKALEQIGDPVAVPALLRALNDDDQTTRRSIAKALEYFADPSALDALIDALDDANNSIRCIAASALGHIGDSAAVEPLLGLLDHENGAVRQTAAAALGQIGDPDCVDELLMALDDPDSQVRRVTVDALAHIGEPKSVSGLIPLLHDTARQLALDPRVCDNTASALERIGTDEALAALADWRETEPGDYAIWQTYRKMGTV